MLARNRRGYTLIELVVTVLLIGILASIAIPDYMRSVEVGKADDAVSTVNMIGTTNKMFALDHANVGVSGTFPIAAGGTCGVVACPALGPWTACSLVWCKYLADQDWGDKPYSYNACTGGGGGGAPIACGANMTAVANRGGTAAPAPGGAYVGWGYTVGTSGQITLQGGAPAPTY